MNAPIAKLRGEVELEAIEAEIKTEELAALSSLHRIGHRLAEIKFRELYKEAGFKSWSAYCNSGRTEYSTSQADRLIRAADLGPKLPPIGGADWTESQLRELCKCETDNDAKRVAKKAIALAQKKNQRVTAKLIREIRDSNEETGAARERLKNQLEAASMENHLKKLRLLMIEWTNALNELDPIHWENVSPIATKTTLTIAEQLIEVIRSRSGTR